MTLCVTEAERLWSSHCSVPANTTILTGRNALEWCDEFILFNLVPGERTVKTDTRDGT